MEKTYEIRVNFKELKFERIENFAFTNEDNKTHKLVFKFEEEIVDGTTMLLKIKSDQVYEHPITVNQQQAEYTLVSSDLCTNAIDISLSWIGDNNEVLTNYIIQRGIIIQQGLGDGIEPPTEEVSALTGLISQVNNLNNQMQQAEEERNQTVENAIEEIEDKTEEYNSNAVEKTNEFNNNVDNKTTEIEEYTNNKKIELDKYAENNVKKELDTYAENKITNLNEHTEAKKTELDEYIVEEEKTVKVNLNNYTVEKTEELDIYTEQKEEELDTHKTDLEIELTNVKNDLVEEFNTNTIAKTEEYNVNASNKIAEFNNNAENINTDIDELASQLPWNITKKVKRIDVLDSATYTKNKLNILGDLAQSKRSGKNKLKNTATNQTINGVTFTVNADKSVTANGTATAGINFYINNKFSLSAGEYIISDGVNATSTTYFTYLDPINVTTYSKTNNKFVVTEERNDYATRIVIREGQTLNNVTFYPMIEEGTVATEYEEHGVVPSTEYSAIPSVATGIQKIKQVQNILPWSPDEWEQGTITGTGALSNSTTRIRSKNYIPITSLKAYDVDTINGTKVIAQRYYDKDYNFIASGYDTGFLSALYAPAGAVYAKFVVQNDTVTAVDVNYVEQTKIRIWQRTSIIEYILDLGTSELCKLVDEEGKTITEDRIVYKDKKYQIEKNIEKIESYNGEQITTPYISSTGELSEGATVYYQLTNPTYIDCTTEQSTVLEQLYNLRLQQGSNNIWVEADGLAVEVQLEYMQDNQLIINNLQTQIDELKQAILSLGGN